MTPFETKFMEALIAHLGYPYIWGGHGDKVWVSPEKGLQPILAQLGPNPYQPAVRMGFDCSGLVTFCCQRAGGPDLRGHHNALTLHQALKSAPPATTLDTRVLLHFYGTPVYHVQVGYGELVYEAAGGNSKTRTWQDAYASESPRVRHGFNKHGHYKGSALLNDLTTLK